MTRVRHAHQPTGRELRPDKLATAVKACALAIVTLLVLAFLASWQPWGPGL